MENDSPKHEFYSVPADKESQGALMSMISSDNFSYKARISTNEAEKLARAQDDLEPGEIVVDVSLVELPDLFPLPKSMEKCRSWGIQLVKEDLHDFIDYDQSDMYGSELDTVNNEEVYELDSKLNVAIVAANTIHNLLQDRENIQNSDTDSVSDESEFDRKNIVLRYVDDYLLEHPNAVFDPEKNGSLLHTGQFINFYREKILIELTSLEISEKLADFRETLANTLEKPVITRQIGKNAALRVREHTLNQPIIVANPLSVLMRGDGDGGDPLGWFEPASRRCFIDPLSISKSVDRQNMDEKKRDATIMWVMAHEFIHAATNEVQRNFVVNNDYSGYNAEVTTKDLWPRFFYEGMTEKLAHLLAHNARPDLFKPDPASRYRKDLYEHELREHFSDTPKELLSPKYIQESRQRNPSSYPSFRLLIDTLMEKADWGKAGINRSQADKLAIAAFLERDDDSPRHQWIDRKKFMSALHSATQPGIMNKLGFIVENYGAFAALDVLESPLFDIKKDQLKQIVSDSHQRSLTVARRQLKIRVASLSRMEQMGAPSYLIDRSKELIDEVVPLVADSWVMIDAIKAYRAQLRHEYGTRKRYIKDGDRLINAIMNKAIFESVVHEPVDIENIADHQRKLEIWASVKPKRKKAWARQNKQTKQTNRRQFLK